METVGGRLQSLSCTDVRLAGHGGEGKHHYPYSQAPVRKHRATHRALSRGLFFYTSDGVVMKQKKQQKKILSRLMWQHCARYMPNIPCSAIKLQRKAIKKGKRKRRQRRHGSLAAKKISFKD